MEHSNAYRIYPCGDQAITLELGNTIDKTINRQVISLFYFLQEKHFPVVKDIIPSYHTLTLVYDLLQLKKLLPAGTGFDYMRNLLEQALQDCELQPTASRKIRVPVCYDDAFGADLAAVADVHGLSVPEVIDLHTSRSYYVYLIGFLPGFAYMGSVDERIATPRRSSPRTTVAAGSVGIAGEQTGIYPFDSPGGWQLLGRTPLRMFDASREEPALLQPGDEVQFYPIAIAEYNTLQQHGHPHS
jgi:inhibitor of KinA